MASLIYYRDPRAPRNVEGPFTIEQARTLAQEGLLQRTDHVSLDGQTWLPATDFEPDLFAGTGGGGKDSALWKSRATRLAQTLREHSLAAWSYLKRVALFYWTERSELWWLAREYAPILKESGTRREIRVSEDDATHAIAFDDEQWHVDLPDCCVVCGEPSDRDWNVEQRSVPNLTWTFWSPLVGLLLGLVAWFVFSQRWLILVGLLAGFLVGYRKRGEAVVAIRFRRCREHLNRTKIPRLRTFRNTLVIGVGDRKVWRRFYYGDRDVETPIAVPPDFSQAVKEQADPWSERDARPTYPTIPLAGDEAADGKDNPAEQP
jgi:hypothetical protein